MGLTHLWYTCCIDTKSVPNLGAAVAPSFNGKTTVKMHGDTFAIMAQSKNPEAAFKVYTRAAARLGCRLEVRTTVHPALLGDEDLAGLARELAARGVTRYVVQAFRPQGCRNAELRASATRTRPLQETGREFAGLFQDFSVRA